MAGASNVRQTADDLIWRDGVVSAPLFGPLSTLIELANVEPYAIRGVLSLDLKGIAVGRFVGTLLHVYCTGSKKKLLLCHYNCGCEVGRIRSAVITNAF
jgi:hypothetical protein